MRARTLWQLCCPFFNADFVEMVSKMIDEATYDDFWEKLEAVK